MSTTLHAFPDQPTVPPPHFRRVSRLHEAEFDRVKKAVPRGSQRATHGRYVLRALTARPEFLALYASRRRTLHVVLESLIVRADYESMTTRPGWAYLCDRTGKSRRTIARALATLREWGLLGIVATGRSAAYASLDENDERHNEAAVYVLCTPALYIAPDPSEKFGNEIGTPPAVGGSHLKYLKDPHAHARENDRGGAAPPPESTPGGFAAPTPPATNRPHLLWPAHKTTASKKQRVAAASELRRRVFMLRPMSPKDVAASVRDFLVCGWTVGDLHFALDFQPDGSPWPHDGVPAGADASRLRGWLRYRLAAWRIANGEPMRSRDQQRANVAAENRAAAIKATEEAKRAIEARAARVEEDSPSKVIALTTIRAMFRN